MRNLSFLVFVVLTFICWGIYGPVLHIGQEKMGDGPGKLSSLRPFICVGFAYFLIAVIFPLLVLFSKGEQGSWSGTGIVWSFGAGLVGAVGALGIILAFKFQGKPVYVMPLVFGLAPIVNTFVTMAMAGTFKQASLRFYIAIIIVALGASGVLIFKPKPPKPAVISSPVAEPTGVKLVSMTSRAFLRQDDPSAQTSGQDVGSPTNPDAGESFSNESDTQMNANEKDPNLVSDVLGPGWLIGLCVFVTALCWGAYGPVLHKGQSKMNGSRLRPFLCVGIAYFAIAVIVPFLLLDTFEEPGGFDQYEGVTWSLLAGIAGAVGALGIIYAFNFGGKPIYVMPLVFGFAPVVNTLTETFSKDLFEQVTVYFVLSLVSVIVGAVMVLVFAPRGPKPGPATKPATQ